MVIKVMVADDQALIRESLKIILSAHPDIEAVSYTHLTLPTSDLV